METLTQEFTGAEIEQRIESFLSYKETVYLLRLMSTWIEHTVNQRRADTLMGNFTPYTVKRLLFECFNTVTGTLSAIKYDPSKPIDPEHAKTKRLIAELPQELKDRLYKGL